SERDIDIMTFLASLAGERLFFDGDHSTGVGGDMRGATTIATQMLAYYAMGDTIAARSVTLGGMRGGQPLETGSDRGLFDTAFGCGRLDADADASAPSRRAPARAERTWIRAGPRGYRRERTGRPATRRRGAGDRPLSLGILAGVRLYNTLTRMVEDVVPVEPG